MLDNCAENSIISGLWFLRIFPDFSIFTQHPVDSSPSSFFRSGISLITQQLLPPQGCVPSLQKGEKTKSMLPHWDKDVHSENELLPSIELL